MKYAIQRYQRTVNAMGQSISFGFLKIKNAKQYPALNLIADSRRKFFSYLCSIAEPFSVGPIVVGADFTHGSLSKAMLPWMQQLPRNEGQR